MEPSEEQQRETRALDRERLAEQAKAVAVVTARQEAAAEAAKSEVAKQLVEDEKADKAAEKEDSKSKK